ncbi:MAG: mandelate racemase/muconate lactonizing enzyme family protein [Verrucomicrobia bacterium]|nr:mandelate racemase/muconate lactonizing enzyme family protein [Verrucomicrobiota bacterium]
MNKLSRRAFIGSTALGAGALTLSSCSSAKPNAGARMSPLDGIERENIKITDVKMTILSHEFEEKHQWYVAGRYAWKTDTMILQIFTDQGIIGIGEGSPYGYLDRMKEYVEKHVKPNLIGQNPFDVDLLTCGATNPWGGSGSTAYFTDRTICCAWAGTNNALWDIIGRAKNMPVYKLLATDNEPDPHIRLYASGGVEYTWYDSGRPTLPEVIAGYKAKGYTASKFRVGTDWKVAGMTVQKYIPWIEKVREAVGPDFDLCQEHNMRLTLDECKEIAPTYERLKFHWLEEPFNRNEEGAVEGHIELCEMLPTVMVSGGEGMHNRFEFKEFVDRNAYDIVQPDCNILGISEAWAIARMAHLKGKLCCPHNWHGGMTTMANAHFVAGIPNRHMLELNQTYNPFHTDLFVEPMVPKNGYLDVPDRPGLGMELKPLEDLKKKYPYLPGSWYRTNPRDQA